MATESFSGYSGRVLVQIRKDIGPRLEWAMVALFVSAGGAVLLQVFDLVPKGQISDRVLVAAIPTLIVVVVYCGFHAIRAPWKLHNQANEQKEAQFQGLMEGRDLICTELNRVKLDLETKLNKVTLDLESALESLRTSGPEIVIGYQDTALGSGFFFENRSTAKDAYCISLSKLCGPCWDLDSEVTPLLTKSGKCPVPLIELRKSNGERLPGEFKDFFYDACGETDASVTFNIRYSDAWGTVYDRRAFTVTSWHTVQLQRAMEIHHDPIRLVRNRQTPTESGSNA
jgi:hypothetical protein